MEADLLFEGMKESVMNLLNGRKKNVDLKGCTVFFILCKIMSVVNFVSCKEITLKG